MTCIEGIESTPEGNYPMPLASVMTCLEGIEVFASGSKGNALCEILVMK